MADYLGPRGNIEFFVTDWEEISAEVEEGGLRHLEFDLELETILSKKMTSIDWSSEMASCK